MCKLFFFILRLGLESLLGRLNQQSFRTMIAIRPKLAVMPHYQSCVVRNYLKKYQKFFIFTLGVRKCTMVFFHQESIRDFFKGVKSCDSRSNQAPFQNIKNFQGIIFSENITIFFRNNFCLVLGLESAPKRCIYHYSNTCVVLLVALVLLVNIYDQLRHKIQLF